MAYEDYYQQTLEYRRNIQSCFPEAQRKIIPSDIKRKKRQSAFLRALFKEYGRPIKMPFNLIVLALWCSIPSAVFSPIIRIIINSAFGPKQSEFYRFPKPQMPIDGYIDAFIYTLLFSMIFMIIFAFLEVPNLARQYEELDDEEDCKLLAREIASEEALLNKYNYALAAREREIRNLRSTAEYEARQKAEASDSRRARVKELEDSLFAEWRRYKARVDFDGSTPDVQLLPGFWRELPAFPVMRSPDIGLLRESQTPYLKTVLGDYWNCLPIPPKLIW